jgi:hypothetical protein
MAIQSELKTKPDRRESFREYMRKLNPTAPAKSIVDAGLAVTNLHGALYLTMAARADLDPGSQQILVGGIGSGKTTELLLAERWLKDQGRTVCLYIDISAETDLSGLNSGALLAGFGLHLLEALQELRSLVREEDFLPREQHPTFEALAIQLRHFAFGKTESVWVEHDDDPYEPPDCDPRDHDEPDPRSGYYVSRTTPGKLKPPQPFPPLQRDIEKIGEPLEFFVSILKKHALDLVVIFDGLDRLITPDKFWAVVHQDLRAFKRLGVAVLAAAPLSILFGSGRPVAEHFDRVHHIPTVPVQPGQTASLKTVLKQRGALELTTVANIEKICRLSGGVLRDLITIARDAGESAYLDGSDEVKSVHVKAAGLQLGESYLRGLSANQIKLLTRLTKDGAFDVGSGEGIELLATRRVLEYSATTFKVHPALEPLITA